MIALHYFASIREAVGCAGESLTLPESVADVEGLVAYLVAQEPERFSVLAENKRVLVAVNQTVVDRAHRLQGDEEVAFFPPVTGG